jgi:hypothetical protein
MRTRREAERQVAEEILNIMDTYHEQQNSENGVDTPGGLEHMGDVWKLLSHWEEVLHNVLPEELGP